MMSSDGDADNGADRAADRCVVSLVGEFDLSTLDELRQALRQPVDSLPTRSVLLDFSGVTFFDSLSIGALVDAVTEYQQRGLAVCGTGANPVLVRSLKITGVYDLIFPSSASSTPPGQPGHRPPAQP
jgi:stage II sporulation protein AA (anti-sigma F factor antagonist)